MERMNEDVPAELAIVTTALRAWMEAMLISERSVMVTSDTMTAFKGTFHRGATYVVSILMCIKRPDDLHRKRTTKMAVLDRGQKTRAFETPMRSR